MLDASLVEHPKRRAVSMEPVWLSMGLRCVLVFYEDSTTIAVEILDAGGGARLLRQPCADPDEAAHVAQELYALCEVA